MAGCRLETVILGLIGGEMLITPPSLWLDYTLPVCCQARPLSCNHWKLRAEAVVSEQTRHRRSHTTSWRPVTLWPLLGQWKDPYLILSEHLCMVTAHRPTRAQTRAHYTAIRKTPAMKPFVTLFFFSSSSCYVHCLLFPSSCFSLLFWPTSITVAEGPVLECIHTHTHMLTLSTVSRVLILAAFSCFTFKTGTGSRQFLPHTPQLLPLHFLFTLLQSLQPRWPKIQTVTSSVLCSG